MAQVGQAAITQPNFGEWKAGEEVVPSLKHEKM
jgi:hypothetical protein